MPIGGGNANNLDVQITTSFNSAGLTQATTAINAFASRVTGLNSGLKTLNTQSNNTSNSIQNVSTQTNKASVSTNYLTSQLAQASNRWGMTFNSSTRAAEGVRSFAIQTNAAQGSMIGFSSRMTGVQVSANRTAVDLTNMGATTGGVMSGFANSVGNATSRVGNYFNGVIKQTISVGDVFGFYIGTVALDAIYKMTIGISAMRQEMRSTFEYMGYNKGEVKAFSDELLKFAVQMPKLSIAGVNEIARMSVMGGASMKQVSTWKKTWADMQAIAQSIGDISPEVASTKVGAAIVDAMGGSYKRLQNVMNVTVGQFKAKSKEMGLSTADLNGNYDNVMKVLQSILSDRGLAGVAAKFTSFNDVWAYVTENVMAKGSELGESILPILTPLILGFGAVLTAIPAPIFAILLAFIALIAGIMVFMPLIASVINSFQIVEVAFAPLTSRIRNAKMEFKGFGESIKITGDELKKFDKVQRTAKFTGKPGAGITQVFDLKKIRDPFSETNRSGVLYMKTLKDVGTQTEETVKSTKKLGDGNKATSSSIRDGLKAVRDQSDGLKLNAKASDDAAKATKRFGDSNKSASTSLGEALRKVREHGFEMDKSSKSINKYSMENLKAQKTQKGIAGFFDLMDQKAGKSSGSIDKISSSTNKSTGAFGKLKGGVSGAMGSIMGIGLGPIGIILSLVGVIMMVVMATKNWGRISKVLGDIWNKVVAALEPAVAWIATMIEQAYAAASAWSGWGAIAGFLQSVWDKLAGIAGAIAGLAGGGGGDMWGGIVSGINQLASAITWAWDLIRGFFDFFILGKGSLKEGQDGVIQFALSLMMLMSPIGLVVLGIQYLAQVIKGVQAAFNAWAGSSAGKETLAQLGLAILQLKIAFASIGDAWNIVWLSLQPAIEELKNAFSSLAPQIQPVIDALGLGGTAATGAGNAFSLVNIIVGAIVLGIKLLIPVIQMVAWIITNFIVPGIMLLIPVFKFLIGLLTIGVTIFSSIYNGIMGMYQQFGILGVVLGAVMSPIFAVVGVLQLLWHWITGNSPGVIPAIQLMVAIVRSAFPTIKAIIHAAVTAAIQRIIQFCNDTAAWFRGLPGKIYNALSDIKNKIWDQIHAAYTTVMSKLQEFYNIGVAIKDKIVNGIKAALHISSPSKTTYALGEEVAKGLIYGMKNWVLQNVGMFTKSVMNTGQAAAKVLSDFFSRFHWIYYMNSAQSVSQTLTTMTGNCMDAALAFGALADKIGLSYQQYRTFIGSTPHRIVNLPSLGMWIDPSGIMGRGLQRGTAPGAPAGAQMSVYVQNPVVREEPDLNRIADATGKRILDLVRFGI